MTKSDNRESNKTLGLDETQVIEETGQLDIGRRLLGRYEIKQIKGRGRYGAVYLAQDLQLNTNIAIKVIDATWLNNEQQLLNFKNELLLLRQLNHPNILRVYEYYQDGPLHFITMDWVDGQSLTEVIKGSNLELEQILALVEQLLSGLNYAQETGVSHRDIKPDNILLDDTGRLVIIDFGMSILEHEALSGAFSGTPLYAATEYLQSGKVNATTDLYSAGCVIYQLFYGCLPFNEPNTEALIRAKLAGAKERSARFNGLARFSHWCLSLIAADATQRPQTVAQAKHAFIQLRQQASKPPFRTARAAWSLVSLFVVSISIWLFLPTEPTPNVNESVLSVAILSTKDAEPEIDEAFIDYISYRLSEQSQLRVVAPQRVSQLLHQLGYQPPLTDPQVEILLDLLQLDVLLEPTLIQTGTNSQDVLYTAISAEGFEIKRQRLTRAPFFERDWQSTFTPLLDYVENAWDLNPANNLSLTVNDAQLQQILPVKAHIRKGDLVSAQQQMTQLLESSPGSALFWLYQGEVYLHTGQYPEAEQAYGQALALGQSQSFATVFAGARLNDLAGKSNLAEAGYLQLAAAFPNSTEIKLLLAEFYEITEQTQKVEKVLLELVDIDPNHPRAWFNLGKLAYMTGDFDEALDQYFTHALVVAKKLKNQAQQGDVLNAFGVVYEQLGETDLAFDYYGQALSLRRASGNLAGVATTMNNLASVHLSVGQYDEARRYLEQGLTIYQELADSIGVSNIYNELGVLEEERANYQDALSFFRQSLNIRMDANNLMLQAESMNNVGFAYYLLLDPEHALVYWQQAEHLFQKIQFPIGIVRVRQSIGQLELAKGNWRNAFHIFTNAKSDAESLNSAEEKLVADSYLAKLAFMQGNFATSLTALHAVYRQASESNDLRAMSEFGLWLADWSLLLGDNNTASKLLDELSPRLQLSGSQDAKSYHAFLQGVLKPEHTRFVMKSEQIKDLGHYQLHIRRLLHRSKTKLRQGQLDIRDELAVLATLEFDLFQNERLEYIELQAIQALYQQDWVELKEKLREAELLLRKVGNHWLGFQFDRLRNQLAIELGQDGKMYAKKASNKLRQLLENLPVELRQDFLKHQFYFAQDDGIKEQMHYE